MQGSLGEKIGEGASSEVHAWAPGQVVKLFKRPVSPRLIRREIRTTRAVFAAGAPAPEVLGEVTLDGRVGMVLPRFDGPTLLQLAQTGAVTYGQAGAILADLCRAVHETPPPAGLITLRDWIDAWLESAPGALPPHIDAGIRARLERLPPVDELCHGDLHAANVIMTAEGPRLIDWIGAVRAPAAYDLAVSQVVLADIAPELSDVPERPRAIYAALQSEHAGRTGVSPAALAAEIELYVPFVCALIVLGQVVPAMRERLLQRAQAGL